MDIVYVPGWVSHVELLWEEPLMARFFGRLASFARLILFDKRGTGLSDRLPNDKLPALDERLDDLRAVMDAVGSNNAAFVGNSEGANLCALHAATYPDRTEAIVLCGAFAKRIWSPDYPWAPTMEERALEYETVEREWGNKIDIDRYVPSQMGDEQFVQRLATYMRRSASPGAAVALLRMNTQIDIRSILPAIRVPTLLLHRSGDRDAMVEGARWMAAQIEGAKIVELPGDDHLPWVGNQDEFLDEIESFLTGERPRPDATRVLKTILFTDIVDSTKQALTLGDKSWKGLLERHDRMCVEQVERFQGRLVKGTGDGIHAVFDAPGRGIGCAQAIVRHAKAMGLRVRSGLHTGECELRGSEVDGVAVHLAARVMSKAGPGQVMVTRTVSDLVSGSGIEFEDRGVHDLKGFPEGWTLFEVL